MRFLILILALWATSFAFVVPVRAHLWTTANGKKIDARWIMKNHAFCCGKQDCEPVPGRVYYTPAGWAVRGLKGAVPPGKTYKSIDGQPWACRVLRGPQKGHIRCLFLPGGGQ